METPQYQAPRTLFCRMPRSHYTDNASGKLVMTTSGTVSGDGEGADPGAI